NCRVDALVSWPTVWCPAAQSVSVASPVFDQVRNARSVAGTGLIDTSVVVVVWLVLPRWTVTPHWYSTTLHLIVIVAGELSLVTRANSSVVAVASRPRTVEPTGWVLLLAVLKVRNAL